MILNDEMTNEQKTKEMVNNGSICQITKVKKIIGYYNQYDDCNNTVIKAGLQIVTMQDDRSVDWDIIRQEYDNNWDTVIECFARPIAIYDYEDEFESYTETRYIITRVIDVDQDWYIDKVKDDILWKHEVSNGVYTNTPLSHQTRMDEIEELEDIEDLVEGGEY